jgi:hypothetical protein
VGSVELVGVVVLGGSDEVVVVVGDVVVVVVVGDVVVVVVVGDVVVVVVVGDVVVVEVGSVVGVVVEEDVVPGSDDVDDEADLGRVLVVLPFCGPGGEWVPPAVRMIAAMPAMTATMAAAASTATPRRRGLSAGAS